jgi:heme/copper-type cytochrome/quinol oxidase subunit 4
MSSLKNIWHQTQNKLQSKKTQDIPSLIQKLQHEAKNRKRFNPILVFIILVTCFCFYLVLPDSMPFSRKLYGILLIALSGISIGVLSQIVRYPLNQLMHLSSVEFLKMIKTKLNRTRKFMIIGIACQSILLGAALILMSSDGVDKTPTLSQVFTICGSIAALGFGIIGLSIVLFNRYYKSTYKFIDAFINEQEIC